MQKLIEKGFCDNVQQLKLDFEQNNRSGILVVIKGLDKVLENLSTSS